MIIQSFHLDYQQAEAAPSKTKQSLPPPPPPTPVKYVDCGGRACPTCDGCNDWHRVNSQWTLMNGGKCTASRSWIYLHIPKLCNCRAYY